MRKLVGSAIIGAPVLVRTTHETLGWVGISSWLAAGLLAALFLCSLALQLAE